MNQERLTKAERIERAERVFRAPKGLVSDKIAFLQSKGCTMDEIMEAMNNASGGALVKSALG